MALKIAIIKELAAAEKRVAATPDTVKKLCALGCEVIVEKDAGKASSYPDAQYQEAGAKLVETAQDATKDADIALRVQITSESDIENLKKTTLINKIYLTTGDYNYWEKPQDVNSYAGKIISIDKNNYETKIISLGHRNPQGLQIIENKNSLISTEHGPKGGDEINLIKLNEKKIPNYGWPMSSYGEHYDVVPINSFTKKLHHSHEF